MFQGASAINLDAKGRLAVPTKHREVLRGEGEGKLVLTAHPHRCLLLYPAPAWEPIRDKIMSYSSLEKQASLLQALLVGMADEIEMDAAGRILISPELRKFATLEKEVMMVGQGSHFKIWSQTGWEGQLEQIMALGDQLLPPGMEAFSL
jgi:transcriptional regulator MraZ